MPAANPDLIQGPSPETLTPPGQEVFLHHADLQLQGNVLYGRDEASEEWGINGDVLAVINLPGSKGEQGKRLAVVDYGVFDKDTPPDAFAKKGLPLASLGKASERFALIGLNYLPKDLAVAYCPLHEGTTDLGRNRERENYLLGLTPSEENVKTISRQHLSVSLDAKAKITVSDHSTQGTYLNVPETMAGEVMTNRPKSPQLLGSTALERVVDATDTQRLRLRKQALRYLEARTLAEEPLKAWEDPDYDSNDEHVKSGFHRLLNLAYGLVEAGDIPAIRDVMEFVTADTMGGVEITPVLGKESAGDDVHKKVRLLEIYDRHPDVAKLLMQKSVGGFHGSRSASLPGILRQGALLSAKEARARGEIVAAGEQIYGAAGGNDVISFADYRSPSTIKEYAGTKPVPLTLQDLERQRTGLLESSGEARRLYGEDHPWVETMRLWAEEKAKQIKIIEKQPDSAEAALILGNFPVAFGLSIEGYQLYSGLSSLPKQDKPANSIVMKVPSDKEGEFVVADNHVNLDRIPVVGVPHEYIGKVRKMLGRRGFIGEVIDIASIVE